MSDDLISRQAVLKHLYEIKDDSCIPKNYGTILDIIRNVRNIPTAFDKEKVVDELKAWAKASKTSGVNSAHSGLDRKASEYYQESKAYLRAIEIVEKGGIE